MTPLERVLTESTVDAEYVTPQGVTGNGPAVMVADVRAAFESTPDRCFIVSDLVTLDQGSEIFHITFLERMGGAITAELWSPRTRRTRKNVDSSRMALTS